jgi:hypothetical protein
MKLPAAPVGGISALLPIRLAEFPFHFNKLQGILAKANKIPFNLRLPVASL